jgi:hypothetical protein
MEGSGSEYVQTNTDPDPDSGGPKNIRIQNTVADPDSLNLALDSSVRMRTEIQNEVVHAKKKFSGENRIHTFFIYFILKAL